MNGEDAKHIRPDDCELKLGAAHVGGADKQPTRGSADGRLTALEDKFEELLMGLSGDLSMLQTRCRFLEDFVCELLGCDRPALLQKEAEMFTNRTMVAYRIRAGFPVVDCNPTITRYGKPFCVGA